MRARRTWFAIALALAVLSAVAAVLTPQPWAGTESARADEQCTVVGRTFSGGGTVSGDSTVACGETVTLTATAKAGHCFSRWGAEDPTEDCELISVKIVETSHGTVFWFASFRALPLVCASEVEGDETFPANPELLVDCELLLQLSDTLAGAGSLNWSSATPIKDWDGVTVGGAPKRITRLNLANQSLTGELPPRLVDLEALTELRLNGNSLTGRIPSELGLLRNLTHVYASGNSFTGCHPPPWADTANHDLDQLGLPSCATDYHLHTSQGATEAGSYAFLDDPSDLDSARNWFNHNGEFGLLLHQADSDGASLASFYDTIQTGDTVDWWKNDECYWRFTITEVLPDPAGTPARKLFKAEYRNEDSFDCGENPYLYDEPLPLKFVWHPTPWIWSSDGIRMYIGEPLTGPGRYRLGISSEVVIRIPDGMTIEVRGGGYSDGHWHDDVIDTLTGAWLAFISDTGKVVGRWIPAATQEDSRGQSFSAGSTDTSNAFDRDINALFDEIEASVETPGWGTTSASSAAVSVVDAAQSVQSGSETNLITRKRGGKLYELITRNIILGDPIPICSDDYLDAVQAGMEWWEGDEGLSVDLFEFQAQGLSGCPSNDSHANRDQGIGGVIVYKWDANDNDKPPCSREAALACLRNSSERRFDTHWRTWYGLMHIAVNPDRLGTDYDPDDFTGNPGCDSSATKNDGKAFECYRVVSVMAHELGHVLSFKDRYERHDDKPTTCDPPGDTIMCHFDYRHANGYDGIQAQDVTDYEAAYYPGAIAGVVASDITRDGSDFKIEWDASQVYVEQGVAILWQPNSATDSEPCSTGAGGWHEAKKVYAAERKDPLKERYRGDEGSTTVPLNSETPVDRTYAVVAFTGAFPAEHSAWSDLDVNTIRLCSGSYEHAYGPYAPEVGETDVVTPFVVKIAPVASEIAEGTDAQFIISRERTATTALEVGYNVSLDDEDWSTQLIKIKPHELSVTLTVPAAKISDVEAITAQLTSGYGYELDTLSSATITIGPRRRHHHHHQFLCLPLAPARTSRTTLRLSEFLALLWRLAG